MRDTRRCVCRQRTGGKTLSGRSSILSGNGVVIAALFAISSTTILSSARADVVWLDFSGVAWPSFSGKVASDFEDAILADVIADYAEFPWLSFTKTMPGGPPTFTQVEFSDVSGSSFGSAHIVDWDNRIKDHNNIVRSDNAAGSAADVYVAGFVASGSPYTSSFDRFTTAVGATASHEFGHTLGLRHFDTFGPATLAGNPNPEADHHIMGTGTTGLAGTDRTDYDRQFSEHSRDKLHYLDPANQPSRTRAELMPAAGAHSSFLTAEPLTIGPADYIPAVGRQIMVKEASIASAGEVDYYSFSGNAGDKIYANIFSTRLSNPSNPLLSHPNSIDSVLTLIDPSLGIAYTNDDTGYNSTSGGSPGIGDADGAADSDEDTTQDLTKEDLRKLEEIYWASQDGVSGASLSWCTCPYCLGLRAANDSGAGDSPFGSRSTDSILLDSPTGDYFTLTSTGTWYIAINSFESSDTGDYEMFVSLEPIPEPSTLSLLGLGLCAFVYWTRRRRRAAG